MPAPAIATATTRVAATTARTVLRRIPTKRISRIARPKEAKKLEQPPRGKRIRLEKVAERAKERAKKESEQQKIPLAAFLFLLFLAIQADTIDFIETIPFIGTFISYVFGITLNAIILLTYWALGVREIAQIVILLLTALLENIPYFSMAPINTATVIIVYVLTNTQLLEKIGAIIGGATGKIKLLSAISHPIETGEKLTKRA